MQKCLGIETFLWRLICHGWILSHISLLSIARFVCSETLKDDESALNHFALEQNFI